MGRIILSNNETWSKKLEYNFKNLLELNKLGDFNSDSILLTFQKKKVKNENFYKNENEIVASNGTMFYKGLMNKEALKNILVDFKELLKKYELSECIKQLRKEMIGSFCVFIKLENIIIGFVDETSMYPCYYYFDKNYYLITNTYYNIAECINTAINVEATLENGVCSMIVGNETPFKEVYKLLENEYIYIENKNIEIKHVDVNIYEYKFKNYNEAISILKNEMEKIGKIRANNIKKTLLFTTGGLDSRMELALHNIFNDKLVLGYWSGQDIITNGTKEDLNICKQLAGETKSDFQFFDVSVSFEKCIQELNEMELSKFGEYACIYAHNSKWLKIPEEIEGIDSIGFGSLNEVIRETSQLDKIKNNISLDNLISEVKMRSGVYRQFFSNNNLNKYIIKKLKQLFKINNEIISVEDGVKFFNRNRIHSNTIINNYINLYYYDFSVCGQKNIIDLIESMPYEWRKQSKVLISLTKAWNEKLLNIPYFSHHQKVVYDKKLQLIRATKYEICKRKIKKILNTTMFYDFIFETYQKIKSAEQKNKKNDILKSCNDYLKNSEYIKRSKINIQLKNKNIGFDLASLATMIAEIKLVDLYEKIKENNFSS